MTARLVLREPRMSDDIVTKQAQALTAQADALERSAKIIVGLLERVEQLSARELSEDEKKQITLARARGAQAAETLGFGTTPFPPVNGGQ